MSLIDPYTPITGHQLAKILLEMPDLPITHYDNHLETGTSLQPVYGNNDVVLKVTAKEVEKRCHDIFDGTHYVAKLMQVDKVALEGTELEPTHLLLNI